MKIFPNLVYTVILKIEVDPDYVDTKQKPPSTTNLDSLKPMAAYLHRCTSHDQDLDKAPGGRGLRRFIRGAQYVYQRDNVDVGMLEAQREQEQD